MSHSGLQLISVLRKEQLASEVNDLYTFQGKSLRD